MTTRCVPRGEQYYRRRCCYFDQIIYFFFILLYFLKRYQIVFPRKLIIHLYKVKRKYILLSIFMLKSWFTTWIMTWLF